MVRVVIVETTDSVEIFVGAYDDVDFTASQMCCDCGGGFTWDPGSLDVTMGCIRSVLLRHGKWAVEFI